MRRYTQIKAYLQTLRIEEVIGLIFILPTLLITIYANLYFFLDETQRSVKLEGGLWRIGITIILVIWFYGFLWFRPDRKMVRWIRDFGPFLFVIAIYTNLHDTIHFINPNDVHYALAAMDEWIFGVQPTVWAEQFYHPRLTDWLSFAYMNYYWITLILVFWLYWKQRYPEFRNIMLTMIISYFIGFFGYVLFPAASPYLVIPDLYSIDIWKGTSLVSESMQAIVRLSPDRARDAFPSLHNAITLLTMIMAWRYNKLIFWTLLPIAISLVVATVYLRYHFVVDILAGFLVTFIALYISPKLDNSWHAYQKRQGAEADVDPIIPT
ncbi:MAG: phosphatase PAP2 family protein [Candidatus Marinimicrobia bacterium]|nr:phosphatase PAP2 family protein [Candidatus Neomarinimicrobiota bacterium]